MSDDKRSDTEHQLVAHLLPADWDKAPWALASEIRDFLKSVKDDGTQIDSGSGFGAADLWVTVDGQEYRVLVERSRDDVRKAWLAGFNAGRSADGTGGEA